MNENDQNAIAAIYVAEDRRFRAMATNDLAALDELLPKDLHYVHANGAVEGKVEFLRKITSGERHYLNFASISRTARRENGFVFVFGEAEVEVDRAAGRLKNRLTYTAIYREQATPQFFAWHAVSAMAK